jgi:site-specific DNA-methyltransferase (adenine-specific)
MLLRRLLPEIKDNTAQRWSDCLAWVLENGAIDPETASELIVSTGGIIATHKAYRQSLSQGMVDQNDPVIDDPGVDDDEDEAEEKDAQPPNSAGWEITWSRIQGLEHRSEAGISDRQHGKHFRPGHKLGGRAGVPPNGRDGGPATPVKPVLWLGDCHRLMPVLPDASVDLLLTDPPYGAGHHLWDVMPDLGAMWSELRRIMKPNAPMILFAALPFAADLIVSAREIFGKEMLKADLIWPKTWSPDFVLAGSRPIHFHENILVFSTGVTISQSQTTRRMPYYPLEVAEEDRWPRSLLDEYPAKATDRGLHPTQKPVELLKYLVRLFSRSGEVVLDPFMGSGSTGVAAAELGRHFIGIEREQQYYDAARTRLPALDDLP